MRIKIFGVLVLTLEPPVSQSACSLGPSRCPPTPGKWSSRWRPSSPSRCTSRPSWAPWRRLAVWSPAVEPSRCLQHSCLSPLPRTRSQEYICSRRPPQQSWLRDISRPHTWGGPRDSHSARTSLLSLVPEVPRLVRVWNQEMLFKPEIWPPPVPVLWTQSRTGSEASWLRGIC